MISLWIYIVTSLALTAGYIFLIISIDGSTRLVNTGCVAMTFLMCALVSTMFLVAADGALHIMYGD